MGGAGQPGDRSWHHGRNPGRLTITTTQEAYRPGEPAYVTWCVHLPADAAEYSR
jgi:hypothetical protein